jgi:hypothetical protein
LLALGDRICVQLPGFVDEGEVEAASAEKRRRGNVARGGFGVHVRELADGREDEHTCEDGTWDQRRRRHRRGAANGTSSADQYTLDAAPNELALSADDVAVEMHRGRKGEASLPERSRRKRPKIVCQRPVPALRQRPRERQPVAEVAAEGRASAKDDPVLAGAEQDAVQLHAVRRLERDHLRSECRADAVVDGLGLSVEDEVTYGAERGSGAHEGNERACGEQENASAPTAYTCDR